MDPENVILIVLSNKDFRDEEFTVPQDIFLENGLGFKVAAGEPGDCIGIGGTVISPELTFDEVNIDDFAGIMYVGGIGAERYFADDLALQLAKDFYQTDKLVCAICWAPVILARAGIITGKKVTAWAGAVEEIQTVGATYTGENVTVDGNIVTANGPEAAEAFAQKICDLILG